MSKDFKVKKKDYTSKEKTIRLLCDIISTILCITIALIIFFTIEDHSKTTIVDIIIYFIIIFIPAIIAEIIKRRVKRKARIRKEKSYTSIRETEGEVDLKNILRGMLKSTGEIDLKYLAKQMDKDVERLRLFLYDLVGSSSIDGKMEKDKFILSDMSDLDNTIDKLLDTYREWEEKDEGKV